MDRFEFLKRSLGGIVSMNTVKDLWRFGENLEEQEQKMPLLFIGHGSPMNGIEDNMFSQTWAKLGREITQPKAVLCISAHWYTQGTKVTAMEAPPTIHDFGGFPPELFAVQYPSPGDAALARETAALVKNTAVELDHEWGLDHGTWTVVRHMYPQANIPVLQLSIDYTKKPQYHYALAKELAVLRKKGVLIIGSGNLVHNLRAIDWQLPENGYDWAVETNEKFKELILRNDHPALIDYEKLGQGARLSIPTPEHYLPVLYTLGLKEENEQASFFNDKMVMGSISMTSVKIGA